MAGQRTRPSRNGGPVVDALVGRTPETSGRGAPQEWTGRGITAREILSALETLGRTADPGEEPGTGHLDAERRLTQVLASSITLVGFVPDAEGLREAEATIRAFPQRRPARVILVMPDPDASAEGVDASVRAEMGAYEGATQVRHEQVILRVRRMASRHLANLVGSLVVPQLPVYGWMVGTFPFGRTWQRDWDDILDRLLVDTGPAHHPLDAMTALGELSRGLARFGLGDLTYARVRPWQEALAEIFDAPSRRHLLRHMDRIEIRGPLQPFAPDEPSSGGLLLTGWLASRLGWGAARAGGLGYVVLERPGGDVRLVYRADDAAGPPNPFAESGVTSIRMAISEGAEDGGSAGTDGIVLTADGAGGLIWSTLEGSAAGHVPTGPVDSARALYACVERIGDRILRPSIQRAADVATALVRARALGVGEEETDPDGEWEDDRPMDRGGMSR